MAAVSHTQHILVVADDEHLIQAESALLNGEGFEVVLATTGAEARERAHLHQPSLILMDVDLAGGDVAIDTARRILTDQEVPIVFLTSRSDEGTIAQMRTVSRYGFILKSSGFVVHREVIRLALELFGEHQELRMSRDMFRSVADLAGDIIVRHDAEGRWVFVNKQARKVWGLPPGDVSSMDYLDYVQPEDREATKHAAETMRREQKPVSNLVNRLRTAEGVRTYQWNSIPVFDDQGIYAGFQATGRDITPEREREARIQTLLEERELLLRELQHRVKNDLGLVQSLLSLQAQQISEARAQEALSEAGKRVGVIARIYEALAPPALGGTVQLKPLLERIVADTTESVFGGKATLVTDIEERTVPARLAVALGIIVNEVLTNTAKYAEGADRVTVYLNGVAPEAPLTLRITDDGPGYPSAILQGESYRLGLSIVQSLVDQHGGTLALSSGEGSGACTEITLPVE
ncbi:MAG: ATP-binding protein [Alkalispirochaeta sp.]